MSVTDDLITENLIRSEQHMVLSEATLIIHGMDPHLIAEAGGCGWQRPLRPHLAGLGVLGIEVEPAVGVESGVPLLAGHQVLVVDVAGPLVVVLDVSRGN